MERLFFIIQVCPKYNHKYPYKREVEGEIDTKIHRRKGNVKMGQRRTVEDAGLKD